MTAYVYILRCADGSLYTGWTTDIERRVKEHNSSDKGAKYTKSRQPCRLEYYEVFENENPALAKKEAMSREWFIKNKLSKQQKEFLIKNQSIE